MYDKIGFISKYTVLRETNIGFMLTDGETEEEYFLHKNESNYQSLKEGDVVDAFLYLDKQKRVAATCYLPKITVLDGNLVRCVSTTDAGSYFDIGISKDILLSSDDFRTDERPLSGDMLPCKLRRKGFNNSLYIKILNKDEILKLNDGTTYQKGDKTFGYIYRITKDGVNLVDEHYNVIFIHRSNLRNTHRLGEKLEFSIIGVNENDYYGSTIEQKEHMIEDDSNTIMEYLKSHHGVMNYTEETDPLILDAVFHMSKASFKRALGHLYKEKKIIIEPKRIIMVRK